MNFRKYSFSILVCTFLATLISIPSYSQLSSYVKSYSKYGERNRYHFKGMTMTYLFTNPYNVKVKHRFSGYNDYGELVQERHNDQVVKIKPLANPAITTYYPMLYTSEKSMVALDVGIEMIGYLGTVYNVTSEDNFTFDADFLQANIGFNLGLSYKSGGMASYAKEDKFSWFAGAAVLPTIAIVNYGNVSASGKVLVVPYFHAGIGLFGGIQWTLYGKYYPIGLGQEITIGPNAIGMDLFPTNSSISFKTEPFAQLGIGINLFSLRWDDYRW